MNRIRWLRAHWPGSLRSIAASIEKYPLSTDAQTGFRLERLRREGLEAAYYERFNFTQLSIDPFGREVRVERMGYRSVQFALSRNYPELELVDPPRGLKSFFSRLAEITGFEASIAPLNINVSDWASALRTEAGMQFSVTGISVSDLHIDDGITGRLTVSSVQTDVEESLKRLLARRSYSIQKLQISLGSSKRAAQFVISSDASVRFEQELDPDLVDILRDTLPPQRA